MALLTAQVHPNRGVGFFVLGASLHDILTRLKAQPNAYPTIHVTYSPSQPVAGPVVLTLPSNGIRLRFDGPDQRLRLVEILDFTKSRLDYKNHDIVKSTAAPNEMASPRKSSTGPGFRHVYSLFGPAFPGEYIPPPSNGGPAKGTYVLSYPGVAFSFPILHSAWNPSLDFVSLLSSSAASPASSMAIFHGDSWPNARQDLFTRTPQHPRALSLISRVSQGGPDEINLVRVHSEGRLELTRRSTAPFWIILSETTPQDLVAELGPPDAIYRKNDRRLSIHRTRASNGSRNRRAMNLSPSGVEDYLDTDHSSSQTTTDESDNDDSPTRRSNHEASSGECFYNYFHHGFDILISHRTDTSPAPPGSRLEEIETSRNISSFKNHLVATKVLLHANVPGSYSFNRHRRSRWVLDYGLTEDSKEPLSSEMSFDELSSRLKEIWKGGYSNEEEEKASQRGLVLNRGWGDSPGSSCELLGGWEESLGGKRDDTSNNAAAAEAGLGNTELFGFPGLVFEVLKNGAVSCLTVF